MEPGKPECGEPVRRLTSELLSPPVYGKDPDSGKRGSPSSPSPSEATAPHLTGGQKVAMATMFQSLLDRTLKLPASLAQLSIRSLSASPSSLAGRSQLEAALGKLVRRMKRIEALLSDAEEREIKEKRVKLWLDELRDMACDYEYVLDEVEYELLRYQLDCAQDEEGNTSLSSHDEARGGIKWRHEVQVSTSRSTPARCPPLHDPSFQQQIVGKIKEINDLFDEIYSDGVKLKLDEEHGQRRSASGLLEPPMRTPTSCFVDEQGVHGRDADKNKVMDMLLSDDHHDEAHSHSKENAGAVSIVGMGGLGKTTLAQLIYNDHQVKRHFESRMWVCVSDSFDVVQLTKKILEAALGQGSSDVVQEFSFLQESLLKALQGKRFLLVLDDVWNESQSHWDALRVPLLRGAQGSRVLITTRSEKVSKISRVDPANMHQLGWLSADNCWSLFEQRAFGGTSSVDYPELVQIGREIVRRCKGVPLTVKTLAGLLFCEFRKDRWTDILESELWELPEGNDDILPALKLSYHRLPSPLKPCFAYCAVFPKDHRFDREQLVRMWMAHGYIKPSTKKCMEDVGRGYLEDLLQRSLIQKTKYRYGKNLIMHDLIHDLALSVWSREFSQVVDGKISNADARHLAFSLGEDMAGLLSHGAIDNLKRIRTCYLLTVHCLQALDGLFVSMKYLRVLDLPNFWGKELPNSVGNLTHLRYLSIIGWNLTELPESLGNLLNLQTLDISGSTNLWVLPRRLKELVNLRHLCIAERGLSMMPRGIGRLTQLQTLPTFVVGEGSGAAGIEELAGLNDLRGKLKIRVRSLNDWVKRCRSSGGHGNYEDEASILRKKPGLDSLTLHFQVPSWSASPQQQQQEELYECLQPHTNVKELKIRKYTGGRFPEWTGDASPSGLERVYLWACRCLPVVGQLPRVRFFEVSSTDATASMVCGFLTGISFPSLEELILKGLWECEGMTVGSKGGDKFPRLRHLEIGCCPKLAYVKLRHLKALRKLDISNCDMLTEMDYSCDDDDETISQSARDKCTHIPGVQTISLCDCPKLNFLAQSKPQQLPSSLRRFVVDRCPLMSAWVRSHSDKLVGITCSIWVDTPWPFVSHRNVWQLDGEERSHRNWLYVNGTFELLWDDVEQLWSSSSPAEAEQVLSNLRPTDEVRELIIRGYRGRSYPNWFKNLGHFDCLTAMTLSGCIHCDCLPPLGQPPFLRQLHISSMPGIRRVGREFCGSGSGVAFRSLYTLEFHDMPQWEEWQEVEDGAFPRLHVLKIYNCPNLRTCKLALPLLRRLESDTLNRE